MGRSSVESGMVATSNGSAPPALHTAPSRKEPKDAGVCPIRHTMRTTGPGRSEGVGAFGAALLAIAAVVGLAGALGVGAWKQARVHPSARQNPPPRVWPTFPHSELARHDPTDPARLYLHAASVGQLATYDVDGDGTEDVVTFATHGGRARYGYGTVPDDGNGPFVVAFDGAGGRTLWEAGPLRKDAHGLVVLRAGDLAAVLESVETTRTVHVIELASGRVRDPYPIPAGTEGVCPVLGKEPKLRLSSPSGARLMDLRSGVVYPAPPGTLCEGERPACAQRSDVPCMADEDWEPPLSHGTVEPWKSFVSGALHLRVGHAKDGFRAWQWAKERSADPTSDALPVGGLTGDADEDVEPPATAAATSTGPKREVMEELDGVGAVAWLEGERDRRVLWTAQLPGPDLRFVELHGGHLLAAAYDDAGQLLLQARDGRNGRALWEAKVEQPPPPDGAVLRVTATEQRVYLAMQQQPGQPWKLETRELTTGTLGPSFGSTAPVYPYYGRYPVPKFRGRY